ncbi:MAG TPA: cbb3-type cytochrome oxidase assembly protein CcoS [Burkholderiaceae bacterium]
MESLYLLVPLSALLVLALLGLFAWALDAGQFDDLEREGERILGDAGLALDGDQAPRGDAPEE